MNWEIVETNWAQFKGTVRARWALFTDEHLDLIAGKRVQLSGQIQQLYGITKSEAEKEIRRFEDRNKNFRPKD